MRSYVENNPINRNDPMGLDTLHLTLQGYAGLGVGGGTGVTVFVDDSGNIGFTSVDTINAHYGLDADLQLSFGYTTYEDAFQAYGEGGQVYNIGGSGSVPFSPLKLGGEVLTDPWNSDAPFKFLDPVGVEFTAALGVPDPIPVEAHQGVQTTHDMHSINVFDTFDKIYDFFESPFSSGGAGQGGASGGFVLYPSKPNLNMTARPYQK